MKLLVLFLICTVVLGSEFIKELFAEYDRNSDGYISEGECAREDSVDSNSKEGKTHISNTMFDLFDENTDHKISI